MAGGGLNGALAARDWHAAQTSKLQIGPESELKKLQIEKQMWEKLTHNAKHFVFAVANAPSTCRTPSLYTMAAARR